MTLNEQPTHHGVGRSLSAAGIVLLVLAVVAEVGGGLLLAGVGSGNEPRPSHLARQLMVLTSPFSVMLALLVAACLVIPGEQLRRGNIGPNPVAPGTLLPKASNISRFRTLGVGWHALWALLGLAVALVLEIVPAAATLTKTWPTTLPFEYDFTQTWQITGLAALGISTAALTSLYKKIHYRGVLARRGIAALAGAGSASLWSALTFRWRLDVWCGALGGVLGGFACASVSLIDWDATSDRGSEVAFVAAVLVGAAVLLILGLWMASNFWKAGRPLGAGESYA
jgi:hypothetical protein